MDRKPGAGCQQSSGATARPPAPGPPGIPGAGRNACPEPQSLSTGSQALKTVLPSLTAGFGIRTITLRMSDKTRIGSWVESIWWISSSG